MTRWYVPYEEKPSAWWLSDRHHLIFWWWMNVNCLAVTCWRCCHDVCYSHLWCNSGKTRAVPLTHCFDCWIFAQYVHSNGVFTFIFNCFLSAPLWNCSSLAPDTDYVSQKVRVGSAYPCMLKSELWLLILQLWDQRKSTEKLGWGGYATNVKMCIVTLYLPLWMVYQDVLVAAESERFVVLLPSFVEA